MILSFPAVPHISTTAAICTKQAVNVYQ